MFARTPMKTCELGKHPMRGRMCGWSGGSVEGCADGLIDDLEGHQNVLVDVWEGEWVGMGWVCERMAAGER